MRHTAGTLAITALMSATPASLALAADVSADAGAGASVSAEAGAAGTDSGNADASGAAEMNADANASGDSGMSEGINTYGQLIATLQADGTADADAIDAIGSETDVETVLVSELEGDAAAHAEALDVALSEQSADMDAVQAAVEANQEISAAVEAEGYDASQVVAVEMASDSKVTVVIDDRA